MVTLASSLQLGSNQNYCKVNTLQLSLALQNECHSESPQMRKYACAFNQLIRRSNLLKIASC